MEVFQIAHNARGRKLRRISGWKRSKKENGDFYGRIREFPAEVSKWRKQFVESAAQRADIFSAVTPDMSPAELRVLVDRGISWLREIGTILDLLYTGPAGSAFADPLDELARRILGLSLDDTLSRQTVTGIRSELGDWDTVLQTSAGEIKRAAGTNPPAAAVRDLKAMLKAIRRHCGGCSLEILKETDDEETREFLMSLPGVTAGIAHTVMVAAMGRLVFAPDADRMRVLTRMGPYRDLGLDFQQLHHTKRKSLAAGFLPPNLRAVFQLKLGIHAHERCHKRRPDCISCDLRKFCRHYRETRVRVIKKENPVTFVDLFCGAGGMSSGFVRAGCRPVLAVDNDPAAMRTYAFNHPEVPDDSVLVRDIRDLSAREIRQRTGLRTPDILIGSPPCQGFSSVGGKSSISGNASDFHSTAGRKRKRVENTGYHSAADPRNYLFQNMVSLALELRPRLFLMENVPGMRGTTVGKSLFKNSGGKSPRRGLTEVFDEAIRQLEAGGYRTDVWRLNSSAFGVPQDRLRLFLVASRQKVMPPHPEPEYVDSSSRSYDDYSLPAITFDEATYDLPPLKADTGRTVEKIRGARPCSSQFKRYLKKFRITGRSELIFNHRSRYQNDDDLELYELLEPGENSVDAVEKHDRRDIMRYRLDAHDDKYLKLRSDRPCRTILSHLAKDGNGYIHPTQTRSITVREAARIQSFDDEFVFCGPPKDQWVQVGNAVPPVLAEIIARSFRSVLESEKNRNGN